MGNGDGTFQQQTTTAYSTWTFHPMTADFNGDGKLDVAMIYGNSGSQGVVFLFGNGNGTFQSPVTYPGTSSYQAVGAGEFTGGGKMDIALLDIPNRAAQLLRETPPDLAISSTHPHALWQGLIDASYVLTVTNNKSTATTGVITVADTLPAALTATAMNGSGWKCDLATLTCTRSDALAAGSSYPPVVLTFNIASDAPAQVINTASVSVAGVISAVASDPTSITGSLRPTVTTLTVSPNPANFGQSVTLMAQVPAASIGLVVFYDGASILGSSLIDLVTRSTSITTTDLPVGTRSLHAYFRGNGVDGPSTSTPVSLTVRAAASPGFSPLGGYTVTGYAYSIAAGDFNGDRKADLAIANGNGFSVLLGSGNATFQSPVDYTANKASRFVAAGDFNGDGRTDLVTANPSSNDVTVFIANGDGTFKAGVSYAVGSTPYSVAIGDVDGDGILDLVVPNYASGTVTILLGKADGTFRQFVSYSAGASPYAVAIGDFNGDSKPDLAVSSSTGAVSILIATGYGIFQSPAGVMAAAGAAVAIGTGDFNGDGKLDLAVANANGNVSLLLGKGDGTFQTPVSYSAGASPAALVVADFNGDGNLDVAIANISNGGVTVLRGNGDGTLGTATVYAAGASTTSLTFADFNGDGKTDLAITTGNSAITTSTAMIRTVSDTGSNNVLIFRGGSTAAGARTLFLQHQSNNGVSAWFMGGANNDAIQSAPWFATAVAGWKLVTAADMNADGIVDLIFQDSQTNRVSIWFMTGSNGLTIGTSPIVYTAAPN